MPQAHRFHDLSKYRRVLACGDIHGEFEELYKELVNLDYDNQQDALISVGDLIDRGPHSKEALSFAQTENVFRVVGNHDLAPGMFLKGELTEDQVSLWGGDWYKDLSKKEIAEIAEILDDAPYAMTVLTPGGYTVGFTHADCYLDWDEHISLLKKKSSEAIHKTIWSRKTVDKLLDNSDNKVPFDPESIRVKGIDHVFHGHTVVGRPVTLSNRSWIDTGMCFGYSLSIVDIDSTIKANLERAKL